MSALSTERCRWCDVKGKDTPLTYGELWRNTKQIIYILLKKLKLTRVRCAAVAFRSAKFD